MKEVHDVAVRRGENQYREQIATEWGSDAAATDRAKSDGKEEATEWYSIGELCAWKTAQVFAE